MPSVGLQRREMPVFSMLSTLQSARSVMTVLDPRITGTLAAISAVEQISGGRRLLAQLQASQQAIGDEGGNDGSGDEGGDARPSSMSDTLQRIIQTMTAQNDPG